MRFFLKNSLLVTVIDFSDLVVRILQLEAKEGILTTRFSLPISEIQNFRIRSNSHRTRSRCCQTLPPAQNALSRRCSRRLRPPLTTDGGDELSQQGSKRGQVSSAVVRILTTRFLPLPLAGEFSLPNLRNRSPLPKVNFSKKNLMSELGFFSSGQKHHLKAFPRLQDDFCAPTHLIVGGTLETSSRSDHLRWGEQFHSR